MICMSWITDLLRLPAGLITELVDVRTQESFFNDRQSRRAIVDMVLRCRTTNGGDVVVFSEHKLGQSADVDQLSLYRSVLTDQAEHSAIIFIAPTIMQVADARVHDPHVIGLLWEQVCTFLLRQEGSPLLNQLTEFLKDQGLGPQDPLSVSRLAAYDFGRSVPDICGRLVSRLAQRDWSFMGPCVSYPLIVSGYRWGRIGLGTGFSPRGAAGIFAGFLLDGTDHKVTLCDAARGGDLALLLDAQPGVVIDHAVLVERATALRHVSPSVLGPDGLKNRWRRLIIREPLADTIRGLITEEEQLDAIYGRLREWGECLLEGGRVAEAATNASEEFHP
jgi:hypothetical protein